MNFKTLEHTDFNHISTCFNKAFENYYVPFPTDKLFWKERFRSARVDYKQSWGLFEKERLIAFVINAIDEKAGKKTAYNTGTGVLPPYRGEKLVDFMHNSGIPKLKDFGVEKCALEVIEQNEKAIHVYNRIGFKISHKMYCYRGSLDQSKKVNIEKTSLEKLKSNFSDSNYSWDNSFKSIQLAKDSYQCYLVNSHENNPLGYFILNPDNNYIAHIESPNQHWEEVFSGISLMCSSFRINNIHENRQALLNHLKLLKCENTVNQFYMDMEI